jgi:hypothetical protein
VSGFIFDAKAARVAIAARRAGSDKAAVCAVLAVDERATVQKPQEPQEPQWVATTSDEIAVAIEERAALAAGSVPACYLDAWARLNHQKPVATSGTEWWRTITDAGLFLNACGADAAAMQWSTGELFDAPREGRLGGLLWQLRGERVNALGEDRARLADGRTIERKQL